MSTTTVFEIVCPHCGYQGEFELDDLTGDPKCAECDEPVGKQVRIEGFQRVKDR